MQGLHQIHIPLSGLNLGEKSEASFDIALLRFSPLWGVRCRVHRSIGPHIRSIPCLIFISLQLTAEAVWSRKPRRGAEPTAGWTSQVLPVFELIPSACRKTMVSDTLAVASVNVLEN